MPRPLPALLFVGSVAYVACLPRDLCTGDEGLYLYESKRILDGAVMYRDVFDFVTPGAWYVMAALFGIFGATIETARLAMAVLHGAIVVLVYAVCRQLRVGEGLAAAAAVGHLAICQPAFPYASAHWFSTALTLVLVYVLLRRDRAAFWPGVVVGLLVAVQQQKGMVIGAGAGAYVLARALSVAPAAEAWKRLGVFACGVAAVVVPLLVWLAASAGIEATSEALVRFPLVNYRRAFRAPWGLYGPLSRPVTDYTFPALLKYSPLVLALPILRGIGARDASLAAPIVVALASIVAILNYPDVIHIAFIAPLFLVLAAASIAWAASRLRPLGPWPSRGVSLLVLALVAGLGFHLAGNFQRRHAAFPLAHDTAFGRVDFADASVITVIDTVRARLRDARSRELVCYPACAAMYLMTGAENPTRYQWIQVGYNDPAQLEEIVGVLRDRQVPYVIDTMPLRRADGDPVREYVRRNYRRLDLGLRGLAPVVYARAG